LASVEFGLTPRDSVDPWDYQMKIGERKDGEGEKNTWKIDRMGV